MDSGNFSKWIREGRRPGAGSVTGALPGRALRGGGYVAK